VKPSFEYVKPSFEYGSSSFEYVKPSFEYVKPSFEYGSSSFEYEFRSRVSSTKVRVSSRLQRHTASVRRQQIDKLGYYEIFCDGSAKLSKFSHKPKLNILQCSTQVRDLSFLIPANTGPNIAVYVK
jgi:hypothetical protein